MKTAAIVLALLAAPAGDASDRDRRDLKVCEEAATLMTAAYTRHPVDAAARAEYINREKERIARDQPDRRIEDRHLLPAMSAVIFHLVELQSLNASQPLSPDTQMRLAARAGAACGKLSGKKEGR